MPKPPTQKQRERRARRAARKQAASDLRIRAALAPDQKHTFVQGDLITYNKCVCGQMRAHYIHDVKS